ncbi:MAG TPA: hypothetical protein VNE16_10815 [Vicinamibacterales bacterium]|nr:hypothetical protein [Vicinamibacterales bacterium]
MPLFLVNHELRRSRECYLDLWETLARQSALHVMESSWMMRANGSPITLLETLRPLVGSEDRLLVVQVSDALAWANPMVDPAAI